MYLPTNNSRRYAGLKPHRKKDKRKRHYTRSRSLESLNALLDYFDSAE